MIHRISGKPPVPESKFMKAQREARVTQPNSMQPPPHREDDQPCACDSCMEYLAEEEGVAWWSITPEKRAELRRDVSDDRLVTTDSAT